MTPEALLGFFSTQANRPLNLLVAIGSVFLPSSLTILLSDPGIYSSFGLNGVVLLSVSISFPIVLLCSMIWYTPLNVGWETQRNVRGEEDPKDYAIRLNSQDPLQWPSLLAGAWTANLILYSLAALAHFHPLRLGATYLLTATILMGIWLLMVSLSGHVRRNVRRHSSLV